MFPSFHSEGTTTSSNDNIISSQHAFLKARSCLPNMLCFLEEITKWLEEGSPVDIIYLDFRNTVDNDYYLN